MSLDNLFPQQSADELVRGQIYLEHGTYGISFYDEFMQHGLQPNQIKDIFNFAGQLDHPLVQNTFIQEVVGMCKYPRQRVGVNILSLATIGLQEDL